MSFRRHHFNTFPHLPEIDYILPQTSLKFVPRIRVYCKPATVQIMAWHRIGEDCPVYWRHSASVSKQSESCFDFLLILQIYKFAFLGITRRIQLASINLWVFFPTLVHSGCTRANIAKPNLCLKVSPSARFWDWWYKQRVPTRFRKPLWQTWSGSQYYIELSFSD